MIGLSDCASPLSLYRLADYNEKYAYYVLAIVDVCTAQLEVISSRGRRSQGGPKK